MLQTRLLLKGVRVSINRAYKDNQLIKIGLNNYDLFVGQNSVRLRNNIFLKIILLKYRIDIKDAQNIGLI